MAGHILIDKWIITDKNLYGAVITPLSTGGFVICGTLEGRIKFGNDSLYSLIPQPFIAKFDGPLSTGLDENLVSENLIGVFPNPTTAKFSIEFSEKISCVSITNLLGEKVYAAKVNSEKTEVDLSSQPKGIYFVEAIIG